MLSSKYGGAAGSDSSINDSAPSLTTTYSGTKVDADNATQDAAIIAVDSEVDIDTVSKLTLVPAASGGSAAADFSVVVGTDAATTTGNMNDCVVIGHAAGPLGTDVASQAVIIGSFLNSNSLAYNGVSALNLADYSVVIGGASASGGQPLIAGSNNPASRHFSPGAQAVTLGTASAPWGNTFLASSATLRVGAGNVTLDANGLDVGSTSVTTSGLDAGGTTVTSAGVDFGSTSISASGTSGMYDYCFYEYRGTRSGLADEATALLLANSEVTAPSTSNITVTHVTSGTVQTHFRNTSGETRRWLVSASVGAVDTLLSIRGAVQVTSGVPDTSKPTPRYGFTVLESDDGASYSELPLAISAVVEVPDDYYVGVWVVGDTLGGDNTWAIGGGAEASYSSISITELPR